ncbi:alpha/beta hydrolase [Deinococcus psychrotolerans]|uniref:Alpha/beta hydrolase n=1 Tax=Deinococcus psychrotolerans TaxID=2489213 RepID=A0A3G8Y8R3_9DEIO|nr:alpha/beta hydrolase [Deinococcus psychrotolerans]AZI41758.1 alpha/beta hydrolase [Deinococcus psychrotolerans]
MQIGDVHLNGQRIGKGRPLLTLHGLMSNLTALQSEVQRLSESFKVIALDNRGRGRSDKQAHGSCSKTTSMMRWA